MKIEFFKQFTFERLLIIRKRLCAFAPTLENELDDYITAERQSPIALTRTDRCVRLIDMVIVSMAIKGELVTAIEDPRIGQLAHLSDEQMFKSYF